MTRQPTEMEQRVAKALIVVIGSSCPWERMPQITRALWCSYARAAIRAMREPLIDMYMRGGDIAVSNRGKDHIVPRPGRRIGDLAARDAWVRMIDAASPPND